MNIKDNPETALFHGCEEALRRLAFEYPDDTTVGVWVEIRCGGVEYVAKIEVPDRCETLGTTGLYGIAATVKEACDKVRAKRAEWKDTTPERIAKLKAELARLEPELEAQ